MIIDAKSTGKYLSLVYTMFMSRQFLHNGKMCHMFSKRNNHIIWLQNTLKACYSVQCYKNCAEINPAWHV